MVLNCLHPVQVFRGEADRMPFLVRLNKAEQVDDTVLDDNCL